MRTHLGSHPRTHVRRRAASSDLQHLNKYCAIHQLLLSCTWLQHISSCKLMDTQKIDRALVVLLFVFFKLMSWKTPFHLFTLIFFDSLPFVNLIKINTPTEHLKALPRQLNTCSIFVHLVAWWICEEVLCFVMRCEHQGDTEQPVVWFQSSFPSTLLLFWHRQSFTLDVGLREQKVLLFFMRIVHELVWVVQTLPFLSLQGQLSARLTGWISGWRGTAADVCDIHMIHTRYIRGSPRR